MMDSNRYYRDMDKDYGTMYYTDYSYSGGANADRHSGHQAGGMSGQTRRYDSGSYQPTGGTREYPIELRDYREGRSPMTRKTYMERKMHGESKETQMHELEKYMQELTSDITEMIEGASAEEKQMLQKKISALATKIV
jgi:hypothetical protein